MGRVGRWWQGRSRARRARSTSGPTMERRVVSAPQMARIAPKKTVDTVLEQAARGGAEGRRIPSSLDRSPHLLVGLEVAALQVAADGQRAPTRDLYRGRVVRPRLAVVHESEGRRRGP